MLYKINKHTSEILMELFGQKGENRSIYPEFEQYSISREYIRNYSLHPTMRLRVAKNIQQQGDEFYLQVAVDKETFVTFYIGNWADVNNQFGYEVAGVALGEIQQGEVVILVCCNHSTGGSSFTDVELIVPLFVSQVREGLNNHWVDRYIWIFPGDSGRKIIARVNHSRSGMNVDLGNDKIKLKSKSSFYFIPSYGTNINKIL